MKLTGDTHPHLRTIGETAPRNAPPPLFSSLRRTWSVRVRLTTRSNHHLLSGLHARIMFLRSWDQGNNGTHQHRLHRHHEKQTFGDPICNEKVVFQSQNDLLKGEECPNIKRRAWLYRTRWYLLALPLLLWGRPWDYIYEKTYAGNPSRPLAPQQEPLYVMSNYPLSALQHRVAYGVSTANAITNVHADVVVPNVTCMFSLKRSTHGPG